MSVASLLTSTYLRKWAKEPTEGQKKAGNYKKGHRKILGMDVSIENPAHSVRRGTDPDGNEWETRMFSHYGYFKRTEGKDKDHVDCFIKLGMKPSKVSKIFIVNQKDPKTGEFDEHKVMIGWPSKSEAKRGYLANYDRGWRGIQSIVGCSVDQFKDWVYDKSKTKKPADPNDFKE